ncbi:MAG: hypothetical protein HZB46_05020 [Solirubrobacterales bacterium]|nr:hypothetical protein [Solirubrobacterales bacterium]
MTRKSITTNPAIVTCDVCGRTLLRGEQSDVFLHQGARKDVCELCTQRAVHEGWIREGLDDVLTRGRDRSRKRAGSLLGRLRARRAEQAAPEPEYLAPPPEPAYDAPPPEPVEAYEPEPAYAPPPPPPEPVPEPAPARSREPDVPLYEHRSVRGVPTNAELKVARALEVFNGSSHTRTVSGVARSLGAPIVSARPSATEGSVVEIVVAWELSWYRFEVDLGNEAAGVRVAAQGMELDELEPAEQTPNAAADDGGRLHPAASLA